MAMNWLMPEKVFKEAAKSYLKIDKSRESKDALEKIQTLLNFAHNGNLEFIMNLRKQVEQFRNKIGETKMKQVLQNLLNDLVIANDKFSTVWRQEYSEIRMTRDTYRSGKLVPDNFLDNVRAALSWIEGCKSGLKLLKGIQSTCLKNKCTVVIEYGTESNAVPIPGMEIFRKDRDKAQIDKETNKCMGDVEKYMLSQNLTNGKGMAALVRWQSVAADRKGGHLFIGLAHELCHALHYVSGDCARILNGDKIGGNKNSGLAEEEMRTVGLFEYADENPSENSIRGEKGLNKREGYPPIVEKGVTKRTKK